MEKYVESELKRAYKVREDGREKDTELSIHASALIDFCPREFAMCFDKKIPYYDRRSWGRNMDFVFDVGKAVQKIVVKRYAGIGILYGTWKCYECEERSIGIGRSVNVLCPQCRKGRARYVDTRIIIPKKKYGVPVVGNIDLMLIASLPGKCIIVECKSMKTELFMELTQPTREHECQGMIYPWMLTLGGEFEGEYVRKLEPNFKESVVLYAAKELPKKNANGDGSPFKFYKVTANNLVLGPIEKKLLEIRAWKAKGKLPSRVCPHKGAMMASKCAVRGPCFTGE